MANSKYAAFIAAAEEGNMTAAAQKLGYTQSGVSHLVHTLEQELGVQLLIRSKAGVELSPEGKALIGHIRRLIAAENAVLGAAEELRGVERGTLRIGTFSSVAIAWLPSVMARFNARYPGIAITIENGTYSPIEDMLSSSLLDCAFVALPSRAEFETVPLARDRLLAVVHQDSPLAAKRSLSAEDVANETFIVPAEGTNHDVGRFFSRAGIRPKAVLNMGDDYAAAAMVERALGFTILPELMLSAMHLGNVRTVPLEHSEREIGLAMNANYHSPALAAFGAFMREFIKEG